jgi:hypothetical protein
MMSLSKKIKTNLKRIKNRKMKKWRKRGSFRVSLSAASK